MAQIHVINHVYKRSLVGQFVKCFTFLIIKSFFRTAVTCIGAIYEKLGRMVIIKVLLNKIKLNCIL